MSFAEVKAMVSGPDVARWCALNPSKLGGDLIPPGLFVLHAATPILVDLKERDLPYLDSQTTVHLRFCAEAFPPDLDWRDTTIVARAALDTLARALPELRGGRLCVEVRLPA